ncbi:MAG TPA: phage/plasmid primase, P4 family [Pirellulales bacterium]|jgi:putative DNA primase/helicase|nr:phage/plasmid primase, P4 family [Pirellulales bacterium]
MRDTPKTLGDFLALAEQSPVWGGEGKIVSRAPDGTVTEIPLGTDRRLLERRILESMQQYWPEHLRPRHTAEPRAAIVDGDDSEADSDSTPKKQPAKEIDPGDEARWFLEKTKLDGVPTLLYWHGGWWRWRDGAYRECEASEVRGDLIRHLDREFNSLGSAVTSNVLDHLRANAFLPADREPPAWIGPPVNDWPADEIVATRGKLVHLPSLLAQRQCETSATPRFFTTAAVDFDFDANAPLPNEWHRFLRQLWPDDRDSIDTLQEWFGHLLVADTRQQKILLLGGPRRSGKSTIARVLRELIGRRNVCGPTLAGLATNFGLWPLIGKSVAIVSDARLSHRSDQAVVVERLLSISGEDALTIDRKCMEPVTCRLPTRLMLISNELPRLSDASGALSSRFLVLWLSESFLGREDHGLEKKLLAELPGIFLWAAAGWQRLRERGCFSQPESAAEMVEQLGDLTSPVSVFVRERCIVGKEYRATVRDLFSAWKNFCESAGRKEAGTDATFSRDLVAAVPGLRRVRTRETDSRLMAYDGICLKPVKF